MKLLTTVRATTLSLLTMTVMACGEDTSGPGDTADSSIVSLSLAAPRTGALMAPRQDGPSGVETFSDGENELAITRVALVLREIELKRASALNCEDSSGVDNDDCEEFEVGPTILELPVDGTIQQVLSLNVPADTYDELEFDVHKPDDDSPEDAAFLLANPGFLDTSVRVEGTWNGDPFVFLQDLNEEQEVDLLPMLVVDGEGGPVNLTMSVDISGWFVVGGVLVSPESANKGEDFEGDVEENIRRSIEVFRDDDRDGDKN